MNKMNHTTYWCQITGITDKLQKNIAYLLLKISMKLSLLLEMSELVRAYCHFQWHSLNFELFMKSVEKEDISSILSNQGNQQKKSSFVIVMAGKQGRSSRPDTE